MQISVEEIDGGLVRVILDGRMDIVSAPGIDAKLSAIAESNTDRNHGSGAFSNRSFNASKPAAECVPAIANAASAAGSSAGARKRLTHGIALTPSIRKTPL